MSTPHISANIGDFAETVLMPGDPLRSKFVAENFLTDAKLVNNVRGVQGYTGYYNGKRVSVMASGMGMPSISIYSHELYNFYGVNNIIRIGSAGMISRKLKIRDIVAGMSAYTNSAIGDQFHFNGHFAPCASYELLTKAVETGRRMGANIVPGPIFSSDIFYSEDRGLGNVNDLMKKLGVLAVEMESYALYLNAALAGKNALCLCTISDDVYTGEGLSPEERQSSMTQMIELALTIA